MYTEKEMFPTGVSSFEWKDHSLNIVSENGVELRIVPLTEHILRFRYAIEGIYQKDFSYALDPKFQPEFPESAISESDEYVELSTAALTVHIFKEDMKIRILDAQGQLINEDEKGFHWEENLEYGGEFIQMTKKVQYEESYFGLGDKPSELRLNGKRMTLWGTDQYGYLKNTDPLYKNIPFYYGIQNNIGYGIFFDNSFQTYFDFGFERPSVTTFWADGGEMNYYFIGGPALVDVCKRYTQLTGVPDMPALWSLGFQQCKWSYYPESVVREVTSKMREYRIPCDAIYLDIDYMDGFRCFTWDKERFPNPKKLIDDLKKDGFQTMVIIDPGIKKDKDYWVFKEGVERDYFCKRQDGNYVTGKVWPGECYFPDFTNPEVRDWWRDLYAKLIRDLGIAGVWNDMNEPALFEVESKTFPLDVRHDYDGHPCSHRKAHNVYGMQMARATYEGVKKFIAPNRSLIITRSGYAGLQRYSSVWTGDNIANWEHLWLANVQVQRLSISGVSFVGSDIGGFIEQPTGDLFVRWIQLAIFHPFCRVHSSGDHGDQEPWSFGMKNLDHFRNAINLRYKLLPYLYTVFYRYIRYFEPMVIPLSFYEQENQQNHKKDDEFLCGKHILSRQFFSSGQNNLSTYLPNGTWYDFWTQNKMDGGIETSQSYSMDQFPFFVKAGSVIPMYPLQQYVDETKIEVVDILVYFNNEKSESYFYDDDHITFGHLNGEFRYATFRMTYENGEFIIHQTIEGNFKPSYGTYRLHFVGLPFEINICEVDGNSVTTESEILVNAHFEFLKVC